MSKLHVGDMGIHVSVLCDKKCPCNILVIWVYMYLFYVTKMSMLHVDDFFIAIHESVLPDKNVHVTYW